MVPPVDPNPLVVEVTVASLCVGSLACGLLDSKRAGIEGRDAAESKELKEPSEVLDAKKSNVRKLALPSPPGGILGALVGAPLGRPAEGGTGAFGWAGPALGPPPGESPLC